MVKKGMSIRQSMPLVAALSCIVLAAIGSADSAVEKRSQNIADQELFFGPVPKAVCGPGDKPESALQGQVPIAERMQPGGFQGSSCNLKLLAQVKGEGASWQTDEYRERGAGKNRRACAYHSTASETSTANAPGRTNFGVRVIDISNPAAPVNTAYLTSKSMLYPHESLKVNDRRQLLGAVRGDGGPEFDIVDVGGDCRYPQLLSSVVLQATDVGVRIGGHEGMWAPDGLTYYGSALSIPGGPIDPATGISGGGLYYAIDTTDTTKPKIIYEWQVEIRNARSHGLSVSEDGNRGYFSSVGSTPAASLFDPTFTSNAGVAIYDMRDIQARLPNPKAKIIGGVFWKDGGGIQHTIPMSVNKKPYLVAVDEQAGPARGLGCPAGFATFPMARIIDMADETNPKVISKLMLETHDPANCDKILPDLVGLSMFLYGSHYCSVDNTRRATTLACGYFNSGLRIFDIRDPIRPREIAYYNPPYTSTASPGSGHTSQRAAQPGGPDWCTAQVHLNAETGTVWSTCMDNGFLMLKFTHNAWPFAETTTPPGLQN